MTARYTLQCQRQVHKSHKECLQEQSKWRLLLPQVSDYSSARTIRMNGTQTYTGALHGIDRGKTDCSQHMSTSPEEKLHDRKNFFNVDSFHVRTGGHRMHRYKQQQSNDENHPVRVTKSLAKTTEISRSACACEVADTNDIRVSLGHECINKFSNAFYITNRNCRFSTHLTWRRYTVLQF